MHPYSARAFRVSGELAPASQIRLGKGFRLREDPADGVRRIRNESEMTFQGGWVVGKDEAALLPSLQPGEEGTLDFRTTLERLSGGRLRFSPWADTLVPRQLKGILTGTTYSHWYDRWCPFAVAGIPGSERFLVVAVTDEPLAPGTLKGHGETAREVVVVRTVLPLEKP
jgi:hypothetical protein